MKKTLAILSASCLLIGLVQAQTTVTTGTGGASSIVGYQIGQQGADSRVWQKIVRTVDAQGRTVLQTNQAYVELATGMNYLKNGRWVESKEEINILPDGTAAATQGRHQAYFPGDIYQGEIRLVTPDGKTLQSRPVGLSYFDGNNSVLIAELKDSTGWLVGSNQVIYPDAFTDFKADLRYTYTKAGFEQDIILREQPPDPESFGLDPETTRLQVLTEFFNPPQPKVLSKRVPTDAGDLEDHSLSFGTMQMGQGKAFLLGINSVQMEVNKQWLQLEGRQFLVEEVPVVSIADGLDTLPQPVTQTSSRTTQQVVSKNLVLPPQRLAGTETKPLLLAKASLPSQGLVLDYQTLNSSQTNYTFQGDTTYYISGSVNLYGTSTFEGGTVIKYASGASINLQTTNLNWQAGVYRPVIFTAVDDNSVGEQFGSGNPSGYYANPALKFNANATYPPLSNFRITFARQALVTGYGNFTFYDCQFVNCQNGITFYGANNYFRNALFSRVATNFNNVSSGGIYLQNITIDSSFYLATVGSYAGLTLNNCIFANVTNLFSGTPSGYSGSSNGFYRCPMFVPGVTNTFYPFQTAGAGNYYLTNGCNFFNAGTTNIDSTLLADIRAKTTYPPMVYSNVTISTNLTLSPQAQRDTDTPDLGYHYDPIDYFFGGVAANSNITFTAGTAVGWFYNWSGNGYGISLGDGATASFTGTATAPCVFARYNTVQEGGNGNWTPQGWLAGITGQSYVHSAPVISAGFTHCAMLNSEGNVFRDNWILLHINAVNCEFWTGTIGGYYASENFTNCLFLRSGTGLWYDYVPANLSLQNCAFIGGSFVADHTSGSVWPVTVVNSAFDGTSIYMNAHGLGTNGAYCDYNAFLTNANLTAVMGGHEVTNLVSYNWQSSWLGKYYQPANSSLINRGNTNANLLGLYHFTTQTNQIKETNSIVDIGYHYVATDSYGNPLVSNTNGIPDYLADANGNGLVDNGETPWMSPPVIMVQPTNQSVIQSSNVTFSVTAVGVALNYQWYFNSAVQGAATNATLTLNNVQTNNAGNYSVVVTNAAGSVASSNAVLTVLVPPSITTQPTNQTVFQGSNATFTVTATGTMPLSYQWYFNGTNLPGATNTSLTLTNVQSTNAGSYSVVVTNAAGSMTSSNAVLKVNPPPSLVPVITGFSPAAATVGASVTISGTNFNSMAASNTVYFGAVKALVTAASETNLTVTVPVGATYAPITETVNGLTAYADSSFLPVFPGGGAFGSTSLSGPTNLTTSSGPCAVAIGDLDGDGKPDLVVAHANATVWVYRNISTNGALTAASFAPPVVLMVGGGIGSLNELTLADLDGDGRLDIVVPNCNNNTVSIFQNLCVPGSITTNTFAIRVDLPVDTQPLAAVVSDLDGDGRPEIITANIGGNTVSVLRNLGTGSSGIITTNSFAPAVNFATAAGPSCVAVADLDGDGKPDLATANHSSSNAVSVFRNISTLGNINFAARVDFPGNFSQEETVAIGDLDGDGKQDMVIGSYLGQTMSVYQNLSSPGNITTNSFAAPVSFAAGGRIHRGGIAIGDLDGDGKPDVVLGTEIPSHLSVFKNASTPGSFTTNSLASRIDFTAGNDAAVVAIGDLDGDGRPDVVFPNYYDNTLSLYHNVATFGGPPVITMQPTNQTVIVGGNANFVVAANGTQPLNYQWYVNITNLLPGATNATLTLLNVQDTNAAGYSVVVTNILGRVTSSNAVLTVNPASVPVPANPRPANLATNVPANTNLMWDNGNGAGGELILNGGFETGTLINWFEENTGQEGFVINNGTYDPPGPEVPTPPFAGSFSVVSEQTGGGMHVLYQDVTIPSGLSSATLTWADRIRNFATQFMTNSQYFHVEIRGTNDAVLQVAFTTNPGDPLINNWVTRSFDLSPYIGQTIRIAFVEVDSLGFFNVHLDNVSVQASGSTIGSITNDVYFGTNPTPGPAEFQGSTTSSSWTLPLLAPLTTYYWQIVAHKGGTATGPVWQFTTAGPGPVPIISVNSPDDQGYGCLVIYSGQGYRVGWTQADTYGAVSISAKLSSGGASGQTGRAYLTTQIGPGTSVTNEIASTTFTFPLQPTNLVLFNGLQLPGGSYYLSIIGDSTTWGSCWVMEPSTNITTGTGVTSLGGFGANSISNYYPASPAYFNGPTRSEFTVQGNRLSQPPTITEQPQSQTVAQGTNVTFSVMAVGTALNYQWYFNSNSMSAATNAIFTLINAQTNNAGSYYAVVSNPAGSVTSSNAVLTVLPFLITTQPTNQTVVRGGTAIFGVVVSGTGPFTYQWQLNGTNLQNGIITTVAGNGIRDYSGDGGAAVNASLNNPNGVCVDSSGNLFIADYWNNRIRKVDAEGVITTVAGNGNPGYSGDGVAATSATLYCPNGVALDTADNLFIADYYNNRVRKVDTNSVIITVAGNGTVGYSGDGGAATNASLFWPSAVFVDGSCRLFIVDSENNVIRKVSADGIISTVAGNGTSGYSGDEGVATNANLNSPCSVIVDAFKNMIIADAVNNRVRKVNTNGIITTIAGSGTRGYSGDGGAATNACLSIPTGVTLDPVGNLLIADYWNFVVRKVDVNGLITTVAGNGTNGYSGDGGPGTNACLFLPRNVAVDASGNCFIADMANNVVRRVGSTTCSALTLNNVTTNNAGVYTVVVTGHNGSVISSNAILTVISPPCAPAPSGLVSWWQAEGNANDSVGTNNGIATNITYTNGEVGQAFVFAGTSSNGAGSYVRIPANPSLDVGAGNGLTFETWINPANLKLQSVFQWGNTSGRIGSSLTISGQGPGGNIFLNLTDTNGEGHALITGGGVVTTNKYQHLAMTYDKTSGMAVLYLNGAVVQSGNLGVFTPQTSFDLYLGIQPFSLGFGRYYFNGVMDEPSLYNRALSAAEIQAVYMAGSAGKCPLLPTPP